MGGKALKHYIFNQDISNLYRANGRGGFGSQTAADPFGDPPRTPEKQTVGTVTASLKMLSLQALSSSLDAGAAKGGGCLGRRGAFGCRVHFTHYRSKLKTEKFLSSSPSQSKKRHPKATRKLGGLFRNACLCLGTNGRTNKQDPPKCLVFLGKKCRMAQEPHQNRKPEPSEPFFQKPEAEPEPPEPFFRNRNRNRNRPFLSKHYWNIHKTPSKEEPSEPTTGTARTAPCKNRNRTEPNRGHPENGRTQRNKTPQNYQRNQGCSVDISKWYFRCTMPSRRPLSLARRRFTFLELPQKEHCTLQKNPRVHKIFLPAILGPELAAPILWAPGKNALFLQEKPMPIKFLVLGGGGFWVFLGGGGIADLIFMGARIFLNIGMSNPGAGSSNLVLTPW